MNSKSSYSVSSRAIGGPLFCCAAPQLLFRPPDLYRQLRRHAMQAIAVLARPASSYDLSKVSTTRGETCVLQSFSPQGCVQATIHDRRLFFDQEDRHIEG